MCGAWRGDGTGLRQHTHGPFDHREPHWSPDGDRIAFSSDRAGSYDIWVLTVADGVVERVTDAPGSEYGPAFSPDRGIYGAYGLLAADDPSLFDDPRVVAGTDSPINPSGLSLLAEMEAMVRYGKMRAVDVLRAATSESARALGYEGRLGVVAPGALADLIVIGGDPTADIRAVRDLRAVIHGGMVHDAPSLLQRPG